MMKTDQASDINGINQKTFLQEQLKRQKPTDLHDLFSYYLAQQNLKGLASLFAENAMLIPGPEKTAIIGKKAIMDELKKYLSEPSKITTNSVSVHEHGDTALVRVSWTIQSDSGEDIQGTAIEVMKKMENGWVYYIDNPYGA